MIPFHTWLFQIIGYCQFVADEVGLRRAWIDGNYSETSVTDFDELYEQIFDDLDSDACEEGLAVNLPNDVAGRNAVSAFLKALRDVNQCVEACDEPLRLERLLCSMEWRQVVLSAELVVTLLGSSVAQGYRSVC